MDVDGRLWNFLARVVRSPARPDDFDRVQLIEITTDEEHAAAVCASWRNDEPDDDLVCIGWSAMRGDYFKGSNARNLASGARERFLDDLAGALEAPVLQAINLAIRAMQGEYGESDEWTIRPGANKWEDMADEA